MYLRQLRIIKISVADIQRADMPEGSSIFLLFKLMPIKTMCLSNFGNNQLKNIMAADDGHIKLDISRCT